MVKRGAHNPKTVIALSRFESWVRYKDREKSVFPINLETQTHAERQAMNLVGNACPKAL